jgi:hypothetical protein
VKGDTPWPRAGPWTYRETHPKDVTVPVGPGFPHAAQVVQIACLTHPFRCLALFAVPGRMVWTAVRNAGPAGGALPGPGEVADRVPDTLTA